MDRTVSQTQADAAFYKTLLESTKAIPWRIDWATMEFSYIGPQIEELLGWAQDSWVSVNDWADRMHPCAMPDPGDSTFPSRASMGSST